jgi:hypothetical protein
MAAVSTRKIFYPTRIIESTPSFPSPERHHGGIARFKRNQFEDEDGDGGEKGERGTFLAIISYPQQMQ